MSHGPAAKNSRPLHLRGHRHHPDQRTPLHPSLLLRILRPQILRPDIRSPLQNSPATLIPMRRAVLLLCLSASCLAQSPQTLTIDAAHILGPHSQTPLNTVGAGRANEGLRADWQSQLSTVQREIGFHYLRFHGIFHDDMGVYTVDSHGKPIYNFQYVDALYDALLA